MGRNKWVVTNYEVFNYYEKRCLLVGITDITEMKKMENELFKHATTDMLTGILNRRSGLQLLENLLSQSKMHYLKFVICFIDIDKLKKVNDQYGHAEGDYYIKKVCSIIQSEITHEDILFRMGGDEFIIIFPNKQKYQVENKWQVIVDKFNQFNKTNTKPYNIMVSHGLSQYESGMNTTLGEIVEVADCQMYSDKKLNY